MTVACSSDGRKLIRKAYNKLTEGHGGRLKIERLALTMKMFFHRPLSVARFVCETKFAVFSLHIRFITAFSRGGGKYCVMNTRSDFAGTR